MADDVIGQNIVRVANTSGDVVTVAGTVNISGGVTVGAATVNVSGVTPVSAPVASSVFGLPVFIAGGQSINNPVQVSGTVQVSGPMTISGIAPVTTQTSVSVSGLPVWWQPGALVAISGVANVTTQTSVSVTGYPMWFAPGALVALSGIAGVTTQASVSVTGLPVWMNPTQGVTILGAQLMSITVSAILGTIIAQSNLASVGTVTAIVGISNVTSVAGAIGTTALATGLSTGLIVTPKDFARAPVILLVSSTIVGSSTTFLFTVYTNNTLVTAGTSAWPVPAGKVLRIMGMQYVVQSSAALVAGYFVVPLGTAAASVSVVATAGYAAVLGVLPTGATPAQYYANEQWADVSAGTTVGLGLMLGTSQSVNAAAVWGYVY